MRLGQRVLVDDGSCPAGQIKEVSGAKMTAGGVSHVAQMRSARAEEEITRAHELRSKMAYSEGPINRVNEMRERSFAA